MSENEPKRWREQTQFYSTFANGDSKLTLSDINRFDGGSLNPMPALVLEFVGECEDRDGALVRRKKRYNITPAIASDMVKAMENFGRFERDRPPNIVREHFQEVAGGFVVSLKRTPDKKFYVLHRPSDGWKFETEDDQRLFEAFCAAVR